MFLKQGFAQSLIDTIWWYILPSADFQAEGTIKLCELQIMQNTHLKTKALELIVVEGTHDKERS